VSELTIACKVAAALWPERSTCPTPVPLPAAPSFPPAPLAPSTTEPSSTEPTAVQPDTASVKHQAAESTADVIAQQSKTAETSGVITLAHVLVLSTPKCMFIFASDAQKDTPANQYAGVEPHVCCEVILFIVISDDLIFASLRVFRQTASATCLQFYRRARFLYFRAALQTIDTLFIRCTTGHSCSR
jgi:hypothetical protein